MARTSSIKKTKGKPKRLRLKVPKGYAKRTAKKFRTHRIIKGKRRPLPKGKIIEKSKHLLDTRQEKLKIGVRKRIKQITRKPVKRVKTMKNSEPRRVKKRGSIRPTVSIKSLRRLPTRQSARRRPKITESRREQMLKNLAKGRRVLAAKRRKR